MNYVSVGAILCFLAVAVSADLPPCDQIPKLLCCTDRVLEKCLAGCLNYVHDRCRHKLTKFDLINPSKTPKALADKSQVVDKVCMLYGQLGRLRSDMGRIILGE